MEATQTMIYTMRDEYGGQPLVVRCLPDELRAEAQDWVDGWGLECAAERIHVTDDVGGRFVITVTT
jgi:hypothetical protein